jgi:hypothetical protein
MVETSKGPKRIWSRLNHLQVGAFTEYFVKMELTMYGFEIYSGEVDDRGIDFVARCGRDHPFIEVQVKSLRSTRKPARKVGGDERWTSGYVFMEKKKFVLKETLYLAFGLLFDGEAPNLYLIPSAVWNIPSGMFVSRDYEGKKSKPEWGMRVSKKNMPALQPYQFASTVQKLCSVDTELKRKPTGSQTGP